MDADKHRLAGLNIGWIRVYTFVCAVALANTDNIVKGNTDDCLISSKKSTITWYSKEGTFQERIVVRNNKVTIYDSSGKIKNRAVIRDGRITVFNKEGAVISRGVVEND